MQDWIVTQELTPAGAETFRRDLASLCAGEMHEGTVGHGAERPGDDGGGPSADPSIRRSEVCFPRVEAPLVEDRFAALRRSVLAANEEHFGFALEGEAAASIEWQYTRYARGGDYYRQHCDCAWRSKGRRMRKLSGSLLLTDPRDVRGGRLSFARGVEALPALGQGEMVIFASVIPHAVSPILSGVRESLVFWAWGPDFR